MFWSYDHTNPFLRLHNDIDHNTFPPLVVLDYNAIRLDWKWRGLCINGTIPKYKIETVTSLWSRGKSSMRRQCDSMIICCTHFNQWINIPFNTFYTIFTESHANRVKTLFISSLKVDYPITSYPNPTFFPTFDSNIQTKATHFGKVSWKINYFCLLLCWKVTECIQRFEQLKEYILKLKVSSCILL